MHTNNVENTARLLKSIIDLTKYIRATIERNTTRQYLIRMNMLCRNDGPRLGFKSGTVVK